MLGATDREMEAAKRVAGAILEFLIAWEEGRRWRTPESPQPQEEVKLPDFPPSVIPKPEAAVDLKPPLADPGQLISADKLAELLVCSPRNVYRLADGGQLRRPRKIGHLVRWPVGEIRKWIEEGCPKQYRRR